MSVNWIDDDESSETERKVERDGIGFVIYPTDPHGFWRVRLEKKTKSLPYQFEGVFTGISEAEKAITVYLHTKKSVDLIGA